ncbi:MAG: aminotransferase class I/II-fold pyridoxal phosphate-dependent enzyme [Ethanoligenens sp.]
MSKRVATQQELHVAATELSAMAEQQTAPLFEAMERYVHTDMVHFDVPGHKKRNSPEIMEAFGEKVLRMDANSTPELDMLGKPTGVIAQAEKLLAQAYGADEAFFLVNGTTSGVQYMIFAACQPKDKIIIPRNVHKSAINALILSGAHPVFVAPEIDETYGILNGVRFETIKKSIDRNPDAKAVFLINPTYFGAVSDLPAIVAYAHAHNMLVLVDEAHGAHLPFHPAFPISAMQAGADLSAISLHKTGGALTQSSALVMHTAYLTRDRVHAAINLFETTSASYLLMTSLDIARRKLVTQGHTIFDELLKQVRTMKAEINAMPGLSVLTADCVDGAGVCGYDETKVVVRVNELGLTGFKAYEIMRKDYHVQPELSETYVIMFIVSIGDDASTLRVLTDALRDLSRRFYGKKEPFRVSMSGVLQKLHGVITPREAFYAEKIAVPISEAVDEICGESIMIYPPGIPLAIPGEWLTQEILDAYAFYRAQGGLLVGDESNADTIKILEQP